MKERTSGALSGTKRIMGHRWSPTGIVIPPWVYNAVFIITLIRSLSYGVELILISNTPLSSLMAFAAIMGLPQWGIIMLVGVGIICIGLIIRNSFVVTLGILISMAVWVAFGLILTRGMFIVGSGGRFAVAALATGATWVIFFVQQLKTIKLIGAKA